MKRNLTLTQFTPAEAENITGVSTMAQRDWRRRGILEKRGEGHARYDLFDLGAMMSLKLLSDRGIPLDDAAKVADLCGMGIGYRVLQWIDAYEGDHERTNEARRLPEQLLEITEQQIEALRKAAEEKNIEFPEGLAQRKRWGVKGEWLARQVYLDRFNTGAVPAELFIWWANGSHIFHQSFDSARSDMFSWDERLSGPAFVLDLSSLAQVLLDRAGRALVHVEFPDLPAAPEAASE